MKLLYIGTHLCPADSLARLLLLGDELVFLDRPSVTFDNWGTIGHESYMRQVGFPEDAPVKRLVVAPPSGPARGLYESYVQADITNPAFVKAFLDGLRDDNTFAERLLPPGANYGDGRNGVTVRNLLINDKELYAAEFDLKNSDPALMYKPEMPEGRKTAARTLLVDASVQITSAQLVADEVDALPVSDDSTYPKLLALRASSSKYIGGSHALAPYLGLGFVRAVIPDAVLQKIDFSGIFDYRKKSSDVYKAWSADINRCAAKISDTEAQDPSEAIQKIIATDLMPKVGEYENELASIRDKMFGDLIKGVATWELPTISLAYFANLGFAGAVAVFAGALKGTVPHVVDYINSRRAAHRKHAVSYLIGLSRR